MSDVPAPKASRDVAPAGYGDLLDQIKVQVRASRVVAARAVNTEVIALYWRIGRLILNRQAEEGWGTRVIARLADDLRAEFPRMRGLSERNLRYMRTFAGAAGEPVGQQPAAQLPWAHIMVLLDRVSDHQARSWYAAQVVAHGWSRAIDPPHRGRSLRPGWSGAEHLRGGAAGRRV